MVDPGWCEASQGVVQFDHEAMVGVLLLEAQRAGAVVIGGHGDSGALGAGLPLLPRDPGDLGALVRRPPRGGRCGRERVQARGLATVNTHDLPPTAGYLEGIQTTLRDRLGLLVEDVETTNAVPTESSWSR